MSSAPSAKSVPASTVSAPVGAGPGEDLLAGFTHKCGRCRLEFPLDKSPENMAAGHWWLCPPCRAKLLGDKASVDARWG